MSRSWRSLSPGQQAAIISEVRHARIRAADWPGWSEMARRFDLSPTGLRENCDEGFKEKRRTYEKTMKRRKGGAEFFREKYGEPSHHTVTGPHLRDITARLAEIPEDTRSLAAQLLGDPIPGDLRRLSMRK